VGTGGHATGISSAWEQCGNEEVSIRVDRSQDRPNWSWLATAGGAYVGGVRRFPKPCVAGSNPAGGTNRPSDLGLIDSLQIGAGLLGWYQEPRHIARGTRRRAERRSEQTERERQAGCRQLPHGRARLIASGPKYRTGICGKCFPTSRAHHACEPRAGGRSSGVRRPARLRAAGRGSRLGDVRLPVAAHPACNVGFRSSTTKVAAVCASAPAVVTYGRMRKSARSSPEVNLVRT